MRVSTVVLCTLSAFAVQDLHQRAIANPRPDDKPKNATERKRTEFPSVNTTDLGMAIAEPEELSIKPWSQPAIVIGHTLSPALVSDLSDREMEVVQATLRQTNAPLFHSSPSGNNSSNSGHPISATITHPTVLDAEPEFAASPVLPINSSHPQRSDRNSSNQDPLPHRDEIQQARLQQVEHQQMELRSLETPNDEIGFALTPVEVLHASASTPCQSVQSYPISDARLAQTVVDDSPQRESNDQQMNGPQVPPLEVIEDIDNMDMAQFESVGQPGGLPTCPPVPLPSQNEIDDLTNELNVLEDELDFSRFWRSSPAFTIQVPSGFGVDNNRVFLSSTFQDDTRYSEEADGAIAIGVGLGDARRTVGAEISYTVASFGSNRDFGVGGFNVRLHRQFTDNLSASVGWRGILTTGDVDFRDSIYGAITQIFETRDDLSKPFSRVALTAGVGSGQFRTEEDVLDEDSGVGAFGSLAIRLAQPVSLITEWTGQDLAVGLSIAPFRRRNIVITPAVRDLAGGGDEARFVLGAGVIF